MYTVVLLNGLVSCITISLIIKMYIVIFWHGGVALAYFQAVSDL